MNASGMKTRTIDTAGSMADSMRKHGLLLICLLGLLAMFQVVKDEVSSPLLYGRALLGGSYFKKDVITDLYVPPSLTDDSRRALSLDADRQRTLSLDLGGGNCKWQPPQYYVPEEIDFQKTIIAGYPSGDKRMIFIQMEALTGWPAKDEWDFEYLGMSNHPFIKANYPHHEGIWGWEDVADQVVLMVRNIRRSMVEYHDILWDIDYAKTYEIAKEQIDNLYAERPPMTDFLDWRDLRVMEEVDWYGWFIDYYMEGGLMRDMFTKKITTREHWNMLMMPTVYTVAELDYDLVVGPDTIVTPSYDPMCSTVTSGCEPVAVISAEKLRLPGNTGRDETEAIANVLHNDARTGKYVISPQAYTCIWTELIQNGKGLKTVHDRPGFVESDYNFSADMLSKMIAELDRLIDKYSNGQDINGVDWSTRSTANRLVELLSEHRGSVASELDDVNSGRRQLADDDFLGPKERELRRIQVTQEESKARNGAKRRPDTLTTAEEKKDHSRYFKALDRKLWEEKKRKIRRMARKRMREMDRKRAREEEGSATIRE